MSIIERHHYDHLTAYINSQPSILQVLNIDQVLIAQIQSQEKNINIQFKNTDTQLQLTLLSNQNPNEWLIINKLSEAQFPVLRPICFCQDSSVIGHPFYVSEFPEGRTFQDFKMEGCTPQLKETLFTEMAQTLAHLHSINIDILPNPQQSTNYYQAEIQKWSTLYKINETKIQTHIEDLIYWLPFNIPNQSQTDSLCITHGNFSVQNMIIHPTELKIIAVTGWSETQIGNAYQDLATMLQFYFQSPSEHMAGIKGIENYVNYPQLDTILQKYIQSRQLPTDTVDLRFQAVLNLLKIAALNQMQYKHSLKGNEQQKQIGRQRQSQAEQAGQIGWNIILEITNGDPFNIKSKIQADKFRWGNWQVSQRCMSYYYRVKDFMSKELFPVEKQIYEQCLNRTGEAHWQGIQILDEMQAKAKAQGLWNLFISDPVYGKGLTNLEYSFISELMGQSYFGHELFNCFAPETGSIKLLIGHATPMQRKKYLQPLLDGTCKTFFAMTERDVASSDPTNFQTTIRPHNGGYVINGKKWYVSGIGDERCKFGIVMGKTTDDSSKPMQQQSMILVDIPNPNVKIVRNLHNMGWDDAPHGLFEVVFDNVFVPKENMLGPVGGAFFMAQGRLVGGRLQHSMRLVGQAARCVHLMMDRSEQRVIFKEKMKDIQSFQQKLGELEIKLQSCRFVCLNAAMLLDVLGGKHPQTLKAVSECKAYAPKTTQKIIDEVIQAFGAEGVSYDQIISLAFVVNRAIRLMDGPCEVHIRQVARFTQGIHQASDMRSVEGYGLPNL